MGRKSLVIIMDIITGDNKYWKHYVETLLAMIKWSVIILYHGEKDQWSTVHCTV